MQSPPRPGPPPYVPIRRGPWPTRKTPRWLVVAGLIMAGCAVLVGIAIRPSQGQRAADMNGFLHDLTTGIQSCAGGVRESLTVLHAIRSGASHDRPTALRIATYGAANCSPANNQLIDDLAQYQVHESLASFRLDRAVRGLVIWASPDAQHVQDDVAAVLRGHGPAQAAAAARLRRDLAVLDRQRAYVYRVLRMAVTATSATAKLPSLPG
jgi:hypothetical protein